MRDSPVNVRRHARRAVRRTRTRDPELDRRRSLGPANAEFVPPPPTEVPALLDDLATFTDRDDLPAVLQAAIAHVQFETIHPFADGNGRVGRALVHVVLRRRGVITTFLPPVSLALAGQADAYVKGLTSFRYGREDDWLELFSSAVYRAAEASERFGQQVAELVETWRERAGRPRADSAAARLIEMLPSHPIVNLGTAMSLTGASDEAVLRAFRRLEDAGVTRQTTVGRRNRAFESVGLFALMDEFERTLGPTPWRQTASPVSVDNARMQDLTRIPRTLPDRRSL